MKSTKQLLQATSVVLTLLLTMQLTGCASRKFVVISADREIKKVDGGWFVPDARMKELLDALNDKQLEKDTTK